MKKFALIAVALLVIAPAAMADINVAYDLQEASLSYVRDANSNVLTVTETGSSTFVVKKLDGLTTLDGAKLVADEGDLFSVSLVLNLEDLAGDNNWGGSGTFTFTDKNGVTVAAANVKIIDAFIKDGNLQIDGSLLTMGANSSILLPSGDPWIFEGSKGSGTADQDGVDGRITVSNAASFDNGDVMNLRFGVGNITLDQLFADNFDADSGEVKGKIVPAPAAVLLGAMGLGLVGWVKRRFA